MRVNEAVINRFIANGIDTVFGIPGKQSLPLNETIGKRDEIDFVVARHETAVTHQAWGYAETSDGLAATMVVPGPGDMNAMNGLKNALNDCVPLIHVAIETDPELRGGDAIHETPPDTYDNVVKANILVETPAETAAEIQRAIAIALTPPKGPVRIGIPKSYLKMDVSLANAGEFTTEFIDAVPEAELDQAISLLEDATEPVILAGGGIRTADATTELQAVAEQLNAPVVTTYKGKGVIPDRHELSAGTLGGSAPPELLECLATSDICLAVGTDLDAHATRNWSVQLPEQIVHVTLNSGDIGRGYIPTVGIVADAKKTMREMTNRLDDPGSGNGVRRAESIRAAFKERIRPLMESTLPISSVDALRTIRESVPEEAIVTVDAGGFRVWGLNVFDASGPQRYVNPGSWATMGTGLPSAIGAQLANPETPVVALSGDGGLMMCVHELHTVVAEGLPITVVVLNNDDYAIISEDAGRSFDLQPQEYSWADAPIDFVNVAAGMGMEAFSVEDPSDINRRVEAAIESSTPTLVEIRTDPTEPQASEFMAE